jgi:hypothetical protein
VKGSKASMRRVRPGLFVREGVVEILEGLSAGESLVVTGAAAIADGTDVVVRSVPAAPSAPAAGPTKATKGAND